MQILLATNNPNKVREFKDIVKKKNDQIDLLCLEDVRREIIVIEEYGKTIEENAKIKAVEVFNRYNIPSVADDTALEVDFLNGAPGVFSSRFAGEECDDSANRRKILALLKDVPLEKRTARFRTVLCFFEGYNIWFFEGVCPGTIVKEERGTEGFGYDSIFVPEGYEKTFAEMDLHQKNKISHRAKAIEKFLDFIIGYKSE
ncbi:MAG: RdgB/HAM1 family non-canonical purine NTP pyrophosphatase [Candidatus Kapaibacteriales bacterium]